MAIDTTFVCLLLRQLVLFVDSSGEGPPARGSGSEDEEDELL